MSFVFECTALMGTNKVGDLHPDKDGYREIILGGLAAKNRHGDHYDHSEAMQLFSQSGALMRRIKEGNCRGEHKHPEWLKGWTEAEFCRRLCRLDESAISHHISSLWLDWDVVKDKDGNKICAIMGKVIPSGVGYEYLERQFANPKENVSFSIRALSQDTPKNGRYNRVLKHVETFDNVHEDGMGFTSKYHAPALESLSKVTFDEQVLHELADPANYSGAALESNDHVREVASTILLESNYTGRTTVQVPASYRW